MAIMGVLAPECWVERPGLSLRMLPVTGRMPGVTVGLGGIVAAAEATVSLLARVGVFGTTGLSLIGLEVFSLGLASLPLTSVLMGLGFLPVAAGVGEGLPLTSDRSNVLILLAIAFSAFVIFGASAARGSSGKSEAVGGGSGRSRASTANESESSTASRCARNCSMGTFFLILDPLTFLRHFMLHCPHRKTVSSYSSYEQSSNSATVMAYLAIRGFFLAS